MQDKRRRTSNGSGSNSSSGASFFVDENFNLVDSKKSTKEKKQQRRPASASRLPSGVSSSSSRHLVAVKQEAISPTSRLNFASSKAATSETNSKKRIFDTSSQADNSLSSSSQTYSPAKRARIVAVEVPPSPRASRSSQSISPPQNKLSSHPLASTSSQVLPSSAQPHAGPSRIAMNRPRAQSHSPYNKQPRLKFDFLPSTQLSSTVNLGSAAPFPSASAPIQNRRRSMQPQLTKAERLERIRIAPRPEPPKSQGQRQSARWFLWVRLPNDDQGPRLNQFQQAKFKPVQLRKFTSEQEGRIWLEGNRPLVKLFDFIKATTGWEKKEIKIRCTPRLSTSGEEVFCWGNDKIMKHGRSLDDWGLSSGDIVDVDHGFYHSQRTWDANA
ncbi:hypothetical protein T439DRAFT_176328 [Meredithblackwellia eburnea MCA 4105]